MSKEVTDEMAGALPDYLPVSGNNRDFFRPFASVADELDFYIAEADNILDPGHTYDRELTVSSGETYVVEEDEIEYYNTVTVYGTLEVDGDVYTSTLDVKPDGTVTGDGTVHVDTPVVEYIDRLRTLAKLVDITPREGETVGKYRARVLAEFSIVTCESTPDDIFDSLEIIFDTDRDAFELDHRSSPAHAELVIPSGALDKVELSQSETATILERLIPVSYTLDSRTTGTFTYITPSAYNDNNHDSTKGYDGLDANGDPKDNGGTYAGLIT